jgi:hypothetical protein
MVFIFLHGGYDSSNCHTEDEKGNASLVNANGEITYTNSKIRRHARARHTGQSRERTLDD